MSERVQLNPYVRQVGEVSDIDDVRVHVGVDHDTVKIGRYRLNAAQQEEFAQLFVSAVWQAGQQAGRMEEVVDAEIVDEVPPPRPGTPDAWKTDSFWDSEPSDG